MRQIKNKFLLIFLLVGVIPLVVMGAIAIFSVTRTHNVDVSSLELQLLRQKKEEITKLIDETVGILQVQVGYEQNVEISDKDQEFLLTALFETNKNLKEVAFVDMQGHETKKLFSDVDNGEAIQLLNVSELSKFTIPKSGQDYIGNVYYTAQGPMVTISVPVKNKNKVNIMVLIGEMSLAAVQNIASTARLGDEGYFYILDEDGKMIAHSQPEKLKLQADFSGQDLVASVLRGELRSGLETRDRFTSAWGVPVIGAGIKLDKTQWALIVEWPKDDAFAVISTINFQLYVVVACAFLIILLLTFWVSAKVARPISILREGATIIGAGHFEHRIQIETDDELQQLGESFNVMAQDLEMIQKLREQAIKAEALQKSLEKEKELSHNKDEFIRNASHQLRTPLSTILWGIESAIPQAQQLKPELGKVLQSSHAGMQNLNEIVNDLLAVSEFGLGYEEKQKEPVDLDPILVEVAASFEKIFKDKNIAYNYKKVGTPGKATANATVIKKALSYLFDNAGIYSNSKLDVSLKEEGSEVIIEFTDDGIGIPEDDKKLIFGQFFRAKNAIVKRNVGTGLGLFIVNNIIKGLGGRVWFESTENKGATFFVALPKA
ncbi:MAG: sensor histidine kinase [Candidatus Gracilibacteria bacterium]